jgi:lysozyme
MSGGLGNPRSAPRALGWLAGWSLTMVVLVCLLALAPAAGAETRGIDVSRFQGGIDWPAVGETKIKFAFVQASRGSGSDCLVAAEDCGPDPYYEINHEAAETERIKVGAYHRAFASGNTRKAARQDARVEARVFSRAVGRLDHRDLVPVLDLETPFVRLNKQRLVYWVRTWLDKVEEKLGAKPMIYTNNSSWAATGDTTRFARLGYRLWVANFDVRTPLVPAADWNGLGWSVWQFTSSGRVRGIAGKVDKNKLAVPLAQLKAHASGGGGGSGGSGDGGVGGSGGAVGAG